MSAEAAPPDTRERIIFTALQQRTYVRTDRMMLSILLGQWLVAIAVAICVSPFSWSANVASIHPNVRLAFLAGLLNVLPALLVGFRPGAAITRHVIAAVQMLWSAVLIHVTGGRIETHFHIFVSLAFLAFYRDWRVLPTASLVMALDHLIRGVLAPQSVYGVANPEWWRFLEHALWVAFEDIILALGCIRQVCATFGIARREAELEGMNHEIEKKVAERTAELEAERRRYQLLVEDTCVIPWEYDTWAGRMVYVGPQISVLGFPPEQVRRPEFWQSCIHPDDRVLYQAQLARAIADGQDCELEYRIVASDGRHVHVRDVISARARDAEGRRHVRGILIDDSERKKLEGELANAQKLEAVGQLAAGIAHEINTPVQFVNDSVQFARGAFGDLLRLVRSYQDLRAEVQKGGRPVALAEALAQDEADSDLPFTLDNVPKALDLALEGLGRVAAIVRSMRVFAHADGEESDVDLNEGLKSTLTIARNEYKYVADVTTDLGDLPLVHCRGGELNQVFLNLLINAAQAIAAAVQGTERRGRIEVRSRTARDAVVITIGDDGTGIPEAVRHKVFDPFFTTKPVGKGTGQGLAISRQVVKQHGGSLTFDSEVGRGTTFTVTLPIQGCLSAAS